MLFACAANLINSRTGRAIMAIRDNPIAARAMGIDVALYKSLTFGVSALYTGVAGALGAIVIQFVAPDSFTFVLSIALFVGLVVGGVGSIPGTLFGGLFVLFVPNIAETISKGLAGAVYGVILILVIYLMPSGAAGLVRLVASKFAREPLRKTRREEADDEITRRDVIASAALALALGARRRRRSRRRNTIPAPPTPRSRSATSIPYSGPASAYGLIGKTIAAYFNKVNAEGGINGRKINFISYDDGYSPPKAVEQARKLVESDEVLLIFQSLGTPSNTAIQKYMNAKKVPQLFVATGATKWGDPKNFPWTMGWQPNYQSEGAHLREISAGEPSERQDRHPLSERRLR